MKLIDSHSHLNHKDFISDIPNYIHESSLNNIETFLCVGWDIESSIAAVEIAKKYKNVYACVGVHPSDVKYFKEEDMSVLESLIKEKKVLAIGEIGLDFYYEKNKIEQQKQIDYFIKFIELANKHNLPIVVHSRDAINLTYEILNKYKCNNGGVIHCYASNKEYVKRYIDLGYYFGIGGVVTFKNAQNIKDAVKEMPLDKILLESDAPYLTPVPFRGKQNHSKYIIYTLKEIAILKETSEEKVAIETCNNFYKLFSVKHN